MARTRRTERPRRPVEDKSNTPLRECTRVSEVRVRTRDEKGVGVVSFAWPSDAFPVGG